VSAGQELSFPSDKVFCSTICHLADLTDWSTAPVSRVSKSCYPATVSKRSFLVAGMMHRIDHSRYDDGRILMSVSISDSGCNAKDSVLCLNQPKTADTW